MHSRDHVFLLQNIRRFNKWQNWERIDLYNIMYVHIAFGENKQTEFFFCCWGLVFARNLEELSLGIQTIETESCQEKYCLTVGRRIMIAHWNCITKKSQITRDSPAEIKLALLTVLVCLSHGIYILGSFACIYNSWPFIFLQYSFYGLKFKLWIDYKRVTRHRICRKKLRDCDFGT